MQQPSELPSADARGGAGARSRRSRRPRRGGFTLIEVLIGATLLAVGLVVISQSIGASVRLTGTNRESALATDGLRQQLELLDGVEDFSTVFGLHAGRGFDVRGLSPVPDDPDGRVGEIRFPTVDVAGVPELREQAVLPDFPVARDLNGDGAVDAADHSADYVLLPVVLRLRWSGRNGERSMELRTLLADR